MGREIRFIQTATQKEIARCFEERARKCKAEVGRKQTWLYCISMFFSTAYVFYGSFMSSPSLFYSLWNEKRERVDMQYLRHLKKITLHKTVKKVT